MGLDLRPSRAQVRTRNRNEIAMANFGVEAPLDHLPAIAYMRVGLHARSS